MASPIQISLAVRSFPAILAVMGGLICIWGVQYNDNTAIAVGGFFMLIAIVLWVYYYEQEYKFRETHAW